MPSETSLVIPLLTGASVRPEVWVMRLPASRTIEPTPACRWAPCPGVNQDELDRQAEGLLEAETERIKSSGTEVAGKHLSRGGADKEFVLLAEEEGADLIVMGSRGRGEDKACAYGQRLRLGGVARLMPRYGGAKGEGTLS